MPKEPTVSDADKLVQQIKELKETIAAAALLAVTTDEKKKQSLIKKLGG